MPASHTVHRTTRFDTIIIGSGPSGSALARELSAQGQRVMILEWGSDNVLQGSFTQMVGMAAIPGRGAFVSSDLGLLIRGITTGGSSTVNYATAMEPPYELFDSYGIDLRPHTGTIRKMIPCAPLPDHLIGPRARRIQQGAERAGIPWQKLEKLIDSKKCQSHCHRCGYGCPENAKWTARDFLSQAIRHNAELRTGSKVLRVLSDNNRATGVEYSRNGKLCNAQADTIVLAAGGIGSAQILQNSGIREAGQAFFIDPVIAVMGRVEEHFPHGEIPMASGVHLSGDGLILSDLALPKPFIHLFTAQVGRFDRLPSVNNTLAIMVKARDVPGGHIGQRWVNKTLATEDKARLAKGKTIATHILQAAGAKHIYSTHHFAAHQGGSASIGAVVDHNLQTRIKGLYVCDASVIPGTWGLPPTLTLLALGQRLAERLVCPK